MLRNILSYSKHATPMKRFQSTSISSAYILRTRYLRCTQGQLFYVFSAEYMVLLSYIPLGIVNLETEPNTVLQ